MFAKLLSNFRNTMILSVILALVMVFAFYEVKAPGTDTARFVEAVFRLMHVFFGILWIGLLYYFNFVQIRVMPNIPADQKPAVSKHIAPEALFWFRWAALATWVIGVALAGSRHYLVQAFTLDAVDSDGAFTSPGFMLMGTGMWLATIMFLNVWGIIWPNQKIVLGIKEGDADAKAKAGRIATLASRTNTLLSIPMLAAMTMYQTLIMP